MRNHQKRLCHFARHCHKKKQLVEGLFCVTSALAGSPKASLAEQRKKTKMLSRPVFFFAPHSSCFHNKTICISANVERTHNHAVGTLVVFDSFLICVAEGTEEEDKDKESSEDLLKTGHLTQLLEANLAAEVEALCVGDVVGGLKRLLIHLRSFCDSGQPLQLQVPAAAALHYICYSKAFS